MTSPSTAASAWSLLERDLIACQACPRLIGHCKKVGETKRRAFREQTYWSRPVPGFGDRRGRILLIGLAPAAHGANRTGRIFTGDRSGDWLYAALWRRGWANQAQSCHRQDGLRLRDVYISAVCRCAPPGNRPTTEEMARCARYLEREFELLRRLRVVVALGKIAWDAALRHSARLAPGSVPRPRPAFGHGARTAMVARPGRQPIPLIGCYHPSQQNTQTGRLTRPMTDAVLRRAAAWVESTPKHLSRDSRTRSLG
jgi:uracil-DNA glycosylase family 4